jgi:hypothetical protein
MSRAEELFNIQFAARRQCVGQLETEKVPDKTLFDGKNVIDRMAYEKNV